MTVPSWHTWFMAMTFLYAMRSPDRQTKQGCVIVDWPSKIPIGFGYNGHPRGAVGLPVDRPDKYPYMVHADSNAAVNCMGRSEHAVVYLPMPPCERCLGLLVNMPFVQVRQIIYYEDRDLPNTRLLVEALERGPTQSPQLVPFAMVTEPGDLQRLLKQLTRYVHLRTAFSDALSTRSCRDYGAEGNSHHDATPA